MKNRKELKKKKRIKLRNKKLIKQYPWLLPRNVWTGKALDNFDYSWTELDAMPDGWRKTFGMMMVEELSALLRQAHYEHKYRIMQIKSKYGELRWYDNGVPTSIYDKFQEVINKYTYLSQNICFICGRPDTHMIDIGGWIDPICKNCYEKHINCNLKYEDTYDAENDGQMTNSYTIIHYSKDKKIDITYDISDTTNRIRRKYASLHRFRK